MKTRRAVMLSPVIFLAACAADNQVSSVDISPTEDSAIYTADEIDDAIAVATEFFADEFDDCTLLSIGYGGDDSESFDQWAEQYSADEAIMLTSSFETGESAHEGGLEDNFTYTDYKWILVRDAEGPWRHVSHGY